MFLVVLRILAIHNINDNTYFFIFFMYSNINNAYCSLQGILVVSNITVMAEKEKSFSKDV